MKTFQQAAMSPPPSLKTEPGSPATTSSGFPALESEHVEPYLWIRGNDAAIDTLASVESTTSALSEEAEVCREKSEQAPPTPARSNSGSKAKTKVSGAGKRAGRENSKSG
jgi:hypothetical protein